MSELREINVSKIAESVREMCIEANYRLSGDMQERLQAAVEQETSPLGRQILEQLQQNLEIASGDQIPICQDTGMATVFLDIGQDVHLVGGDVTEAVNKGIHDGYIDGYLRKSVVADPLVRVNTKDNTPGIIHMNIVPGNQVTITVAPKGFGSENKSKLFMLVPADGEEGVIDAVLDTVKAAGPNACPPMVIGVGIGGNFEKCAEMAKRALTLDTREHNEDPRIADLERRILDKVNALQIGPAGLGGAVTALSVRVLTYPTHIAGLPCAINICCHVNRHRVRVI